jgi:NADPH:quinone reductase-like Zn-dependent oxidoreductase
MDKPTIKCGRVVFDLVDGDTIMDNGACLQLSTRTVGYGFNSGTPRVSKSEFARFKSRSNVKINSNHGYGDRVTLYTYSEAK